MSRDSTTARGSAHDRDNPDDSGKRVWTHPEKDVSDIDLPVITRLNIDPQRVMAAALEALLTDVVIIGFLPDGTEYFASSAADGGTVLWHLERAKLKLLRTVD